MTAYDSDRELVYDRKVEEVSYGRVRQGDGTGGYPFPVCRVVSRDHMWGGYGYFWRCWQQVVGFCGKVYPTLFFSATDVPDAVCKTVEDVDAFMESLLDERGLSDYYGRGRGRFRSRYYNVYGTRNGVRQWFAEMESRKDSYRESLFESRRCPAFVATVDSSVASITYNACLNDVGFFRVFDAWQAYQEISMFLGNLASPEKPIPPISDEIMCEIKGFDPKTSFRKPKTAR